MRERTYRARAQGIRLLPTIGMVLAFHVFAADPQPKLPAFPGAEGFGAYARGGRGGRVFHVANLNDSGEGSLRACAEASVPRVCVFRIGGQITLETSIAIDHPFITLAGQSAPGGGVAIRMSADNPETPIKIRTHDVIIRYLRIRPGASHILSDTQDALTIANQESPVYNVIVDHSSFSWASDEVVNVWYAAHHITFQWNIIAEGLHCINHAKGCGHSKGLLLGSEGSHSISVHHNLFAHHSERSPRLAMSGVADVVNNVIYNSMYSGSQISDEYAIAKVNYVGNLMRMGNDSQTRYMMALKSGSTEPNGYDIYVEGNIGPLNPEAHPVGALPIKRSEADWNAAERHAAPGLTEHSCNSVSDCELMEAVLTGAGATLPQRDVVDRRIVKEVETGSGRIIDAQSKASCYLGCERYLEAIDYTRLGIDAALDEHGWPLLAAGEAYPDADRDGMDDRWEALKGLNPEIDDSSGHRLHAAYTNLEVFLEEFVSAVR